MNKLKGDQYETYIKNFLLKNNKYVWLCGDLVDDKTDYYLYVMFY